jgi:hypothetical protein
MDTRINQLTQIANYIQNAHVNNTKGMARLHFIDAVILLQELTSDLHKSMLDLESVGEQPHDVNF